MPPVYDANSADIADTADVDTCRGDKKGDANEMGGVSFALHGCTMCKTVSAIRSILMTSTDSHLQLKGIVHLKKYMALKCEKYTFKSKKCILT